MKRKRIITLISLILLLGPSIGFGQILNASQKKQVLKELQTAIAENYVLKDSASQIVDQLTELRKSSEYGKEYTSSEFASYLTGTLRSVTKDAHFAVLHDSAMYQMAQALQQGNQGDTPPNMSFCGRNLNDHRKNFFFTKLEVLEGNVGYLRIEQIPSLESSKSTVDAAMSFLKNTDALVIDLRSNPGGVGGFIPYLMSYFLPAEKQLLYSREFLAWDSTSYHYSHENIGGERYLDKQVFLLINRFTGSAATNMAYAMKSLEIGLLVGENTGSGYRGAHSATIYPLRHNFVGLVPIGRVVNAKTNTNWRETGVDPDIECLSEEALETAYQHSLENLLKASSDPIVTGDINKALETLKENQAIKLKAPAFEDLSEYAGQYEETTITWENEKLFTKRATVPVKLEIKRKEGDLFQIILPPNARGNVPDLLFNREDGTIVSLTSVRDGVEERVELRAKE